MILGTREDKNSTMNILSSSSLYTMSYIDETRILDFALAKAFLPFSLRLQGTERD